MLIDLDVPLLDALQLKFVFFLDPIALVDPLGNLTLIQGREWKLSIAH